MNGQWKGNYTGTISGRIILNADETKRGYEAIAYLSPDTPDQLQLLAEFNLETKNPYFEFEITRFNPLNPETGLAQPWNELDPKLTQGKIFAKKAVGKGSLIADKLTLEWTTDNKIEGFATLARSLAETASLLPAEQVDWNDFKKLVSQNVKHGTLFRGQREPLRLRTTFHRTGRANLHRFLNIDIRALHNQLSSKTRHFFNRSNPDENGAFMSLVQHHGYPTPLLDWTYSPYAAAFFAFRGHRKNPVTVPLAKDDIRIFVFDAELWGRNNPGRFRLDCAALHFTVHDFIALDNERMIPQQAVSTLTNIDDIETHISERTFETTKYLSAIDIPFCECTKAMRELRQMGITPGSMFPGFDGTCEEIKERLFESSTES